jgi:trigger factor
LEVKSRFVPEWSDELAKTIGDYESLLDLRIKVREDLTKEAINQAETMHGREVVDKVVEGATVEYPPILLQQEISDMLRELSDRLRMQNLSLEDYMKVENKSQEDLIEEIEPNAEERLKRALVLGELITVEDIKVEEEEVEQEIENFMERFEDKSEQTRQLFDNPEGRRRITLDLLSDKAIKRLIAYAVGEGDQFIRKEEELESEVEEPNDSVQEETEVEPAEVSDLVMEDPEQAIEPTEE